jgi:hypothetical protein
MATSETHKGFLRLFTRSRHAKRATKVKAVQGPAGEGRITDALAASRAMKPTVVRPATAAPNGAAPQLTVLRPPPAPAVREGAAPRRGGRRLHVSLSFGAAGALTAAFALLLLVAFIMGTRYEHDRLQAGTHTGGEEQTAQSDDRSGAPRPPSVRLDNQDRSTPPPPAPEGARWRLRLAVLPLGERAEAERYLAALRQAGVSAQVLTRRIGGRDQLVLYADPLFASRTSPEANALLQKVRVIRSNGRYAFDSAYYVTAD